VSTLWDTNGGEVVKALSVERRAAGAVAFGLVLTLVVVVDERHADEAMAAAAEGAAAHPCRLLVVVRRQPDAAEPRLDAEVSVGGRLGTGEAVVLRMQGALALHAESVVLPLLAPDTPVVCWWYGVPPTQIADDCLGALADRRITDTAAAPDPLIALRQRAADYSPGDTDLAWTRVTHWRSLLAATFDSVSDTATRGEVHAEPGSPSAELLAGWLSARLGIDVSVEESAGPGVTSVGLAFAEAGGGGALHVDRPDGHTARLVRSGQPDRVLPLPRRQLGDLIGEELRRLDPDEPYAEALARAADRPSLRPPEAGIDEDRQPTAAERKSEAAALRGLGSAST
jgi:glucose-6-phosphate dehydrogenase assembly protein OpcA